MWNRQDEAGAHARCPSDLHWDRFIAVHGAAAARRLHDTLSCAECRQRLHNLLASREDFLASPAAHVLRQRLDSLRADTVLAPVPLRRRWRLGLGFASGAAVVAAAALLFVFVAPPRATVAPLADISEIDGTAGVRTKGGFAVESFVWRSGQVSQISPGDTVAAGDRLGFRVLAPFDGQLALFVTPSPAGGRATLLPFPGQDAPAVEAGVPFDLPVSALLDDVGSEERFALVVCPAPLPFSVAAAAAEAWTGAVANAFNGEDLAAAEEHFHAALEAHSEGQCGVRLLRFPKARDSSVTRSPAGR